MAGSILVLYAVKNKKILYLFIAILGHALIDFFPALYLYQIGKFSIAGTEIIVALSAIALLLFVIKSRRIFEPQSSY
ncbi:YhfC family glutamic-type intramembrane protease [Clostridium sp. LBM24168]